ncbi:MAG: SMP-30/gluconolactonase/LRE family protein [Verrucomicrobiota bacterium]
MNPEFQVVAKGPYSLGEGIMWDARVNRLSWIDINDKKLAWQEEGKTHVIDLDGMPGTAVLTSDPNRVLLCLDSGVVSCALDSGTVEKHFEFPEGEELRFNDGKVDPAGRLWVGTMHRDGKEKAGTLYRIDPDFSIRPMVTEVTISNGICWNAAADQMYFIDSATRVIDAFDFEKSKGQISNRRTVNQVPEDWGFPDGMTIDSEDKLWVAHWNGECVARYHPGTGQVLKRFNLPAPKVTSCWFGGENLETLFVTTALGSQDGGWADTNEFPLSGAVFAAQVGASGVPAFRFGQV